jgi:NADH dehydrogenase/NADH:ubiquinone oxidoreductase subunit G
MAIESVSSISPVINRAMQTTSRPPETTPDAVQSASQENDARRTAAASSSASPSYLAGPEETRASASTSVGTRENVTPVAQDAETALQNSSSQISRAYAGGEPAPADTRAASEAYRTEAAARDQLAVQQQGNGTRTVDVLA